MISLARHPESAHDAPRSLQARVEKREGLLQVAYRLEGEVSRVRLPPARTPRFADGLWRHTCCELFVACPSSAAYREFNFSPSGEFAAFAFADYRQGGPVAAADPRIFVRNAHDRLELAASVALAPGEQLVGLSAVIEDGEGRLAYWALRHPPGKPDFHHRHGFALELA